ncbi:patatin-like phospholipase family protein [Chryseobacterium sp.]|uniref:patatin-like phospholipase family protein n=1 Tax=Chryseobacterium sp. TaxID=1871047 RepID=UPI0025B8CBEE|nr:patatin-like phospholipase family protein [Chryseobacterium sp.]
MKTEALKTILEEGTLSQASQDKLIALHENISGKEFSDLLDKEGNQYVEFVQEGGGVWGSALVGYLYGLEIFGIRFLKVAGTSAGAINTILIAACKTKEEAKGKLIKEILFNWNFADFIDGKPYVRKTIRAILNNKNYIRTHIIITVIITILLIVAPFIIPSESVWNAKLLFLVPLIPAIVIFFCIKKFYYDFRKDNSGLNPGSAFLKSMEEVLDRLEIKTVADLNKKYKQKEFELNLDYRYGNNDEYYQTALQGIRDIKEKYHDHIDQTRFKIFYDSAVNNDYYKNNPFYQLKSEYVVVTTDINAKIKVELPTMANLYWSEEELKHVSPAEFVRASMSVPFFFEPMQKRINRNDDSIKYAWKFWMNMTPEEIYPVGIFIDGGSISNFPIDLFHYNDIFYPRLPLFAVQLKSNSEIKTPKGNTSEQILKTPFSYAGHIIGTLQGFNDKSFLTKHSFYNLFSIQTVNCGENSWLNFFMKREEKEKLFNAGFMAALDFLNGFDWKKYKSERMMVTMKENKILKEEDTPTVG